MRRILDRHENLVVVLATQLALVGAALADDVSTSFEFNDVSGEFSLGNPLHLVTFLVGITTTRDARRAEGRCLAAAPPSAELSPRCRDQRRVVARHARHGLFVVEV